MPWSTDDQLARSLWRLPWNAISFVRGAILSLKTATQPSRPQKPASQQPTQQRSSLLDLLPRIRNDPTKPTLGGNEWQSLLDKMVDDARRKSGAPAQQQPAASTDANKGSPAMQNEDDWLLKYKEKQLRQTEQERSPWLTQVLQSINIEDKSTTTEQPRPQTELNIFSTNVENTDKNRDLKLTTYRPAYFKYPDTISKTDRRLWQALHQNHDQMPFLVDRFRLEQVCRSHLVSLPELYANISQWNDFEKTWHKFDSNDADVYVMRLKEVRARYIHVFNLLSI